MKVHLTNCGETDLTDLLSLRAATSTTHPLVPSADEADLILLAGSFAYNPALATDHPLYRQFPDKCAAYTEDDVYLPLLPGVYCSAPTDASAHCGRIFSYTYVTRNGRYQNPYLSEPNREKWTAIANSTPKRYLFSFQGGSTSLVRKRLFRLNFNRPDVLIQNTSAYHHWEDEQPGRADRQLQYAQTLAASHFVLCPRGAGLGSIRFFEVMAAGIAPVLISDGYLLPPGPDWDKFVIRLPEQSIAKLPELLAPRLAEAAARGALAREAFEQHFSMAREWETIVELAARSLRHAPPAEIDFRNRQKAMIRRREIKSRVRAFARSSALAALKLFRLRNPYQMNR